jgi:HEPN domain-containing protein
MKKDLDHLPRRKQRDLARIVAILHEEFDDALKLATMEKRKRGRILKIVLFGSYARDEADIWYKAEDRFTRAIREPVTLIVHTLAEVNDQIAKGHYFFADIRREGIALYELKGEKPLAKPRPLNPQQAYAAAKEHFDQRFPRATDFMIGYRTYRDHGKLELAAFELHQAVEHAYHALLLTLTHYTPNSHNIINLRNLAEGRDRRLVEAWPRYFKRDRATYQLLKRAYVEARYSPHFAVTPEQLDWLEAGARRLHTLIEQACQERLAELKAEITA